MLNTTENISDVSDTLLNRSDGSDSFVYFQPGWYYNAAVMTWKIFPSIVIPVGTLGNFLTVLIILRQKRNMTSTAMLLCSLAFSDTLILYCGPLCNFISVTWHIDIRDMNDGLCKASSYLSHVTFQLSSWLLVMLTLERTICVMFPHKVKGLCTVKKTGLCVLVVTLSILLLNSHFLYGAGLVEDTGKLESFPCRAKYKIYEYFTSYIWPWIDFCVYFAVPFVFIGVGNFMIILTLSRRNKHMSQSRNTCRQNLQSKNVTVLLIFLCAMFLVTLSPVTIYFIGSAHWVESVTSQTDTEDVQSGMEVLLFWYTVVNCISYLNAACNFILYVISGSRFKQEIINLMLCRKASSSALFK